jgi:hypothetical protein
MRPLADLFLAILAHSQSPSLSVLLCVRPRGFAQFRRALFRTGRIGDDLDCETAFSASAAWEAHCRMPCKSTPLRDDFAHASSVALTAGKQIQL